MPLRLLLYAVIADAACGAQCCFDISRFNDISCSVRVIGPNACKAVCLPADLRIEQFFIKADNVTYIAQGPVVW